MRFLNRITQFQQACELIKRNNQGTAIGELLLFRSSLFDGPPPIDEDVEDCCVASNIIPITTSLIVKPGLQIYYRLKDPRHLNLISPRQG